MAQTIDMKGKAALVTGAASGLGRATAVRLAEAGADLCLVDVRADWLAETETLLRGGGAVLSHVADLADPDACTGAVAAALARFGRLDALCNIAGIFKFVRMEEMTRQAYDRMIAVNLSAPFFLSQAALPHLIESQGAIVNCASTAAFLGQAYSVAYCATKAGIAHMTRAMAMEYVHQPVRINAVAPGGMMTNLATDSGLPENIDPTLVQRYSGLRGVVEVEDVAEMFAMLASPAGRSYHGAVISIDAGTTVG
jgi:NAD(P)-dependent dehydrogenase (short-subunit alcohol dehydrogenase family)